jgi:hypothetical protein
VKIWRRLTAYDLVMVTVVLTAAVYLLVTVPGYRWSRSVQGGFLRDQPVALTLEVTQPTMVRITSELQPGAMEAWTPRGRRRITIMRVGPGPDGSLQLTIRLLAQVDGAGRRFWADQQLRRGQGFAFGNRELQIAGVLLAVDELKGQAR